ncbi:MAG: hypothetical protein ABIQ32_07385 [Sphingomicrobium sp.]
MFDKLTPLGCGLLIAASAIIAGVTGYLWLAGSAVVIDDTGEVASAVIKSSGTPNKRLHRLWRGYFYATPDNDGAIEVRCRDGSRKEWGYVTFGVHTRVRVIGPTPCARVVDD